MSWKNGQGTTSQIELFPASADFSKNDFDWRISQAQISTTNSFSLFPGYDRCLTVLSGTGIKLNKEHLLKNQVHRFRGEDPVECSLIDDPVEDLGVIFKRDAYHCEMHVEHLHTPKKLSLNDGVHFIKALNETLIVTSKIIGLKNILRAQGDGELLVTGESNAGLALVISIVKK